MKHTSKWDIDLKFGKSGEDRVANLLNAEQSKIEVKTERDWWYKTGNIAIEIECRGKPSGLYATEADYWVHILHKDGKDYCKLFSSLVLSFNYFSKDYYKLFVLLSLISN